MKQTITILFLFIHIFAYSQEYNWKRAIIPASLSFVSGSSMGLHETILNHYSGFKTVFPAANDKYWNPEISWTNKYKGGEVSNGAKFPGSTTILVWTTDAYHLTNTVHRATLFCAGVSIGIGEKRKWWHYGIDAGISFLAYSAGFHLVYSGIF